MTFVRNLLVVAIAFASPVAFSVTPREEQRANPQSDYMKAVSTIFASIDMDGAGKAEVVATKDYNKTLPGYEIVDGKAVYRISDDVAAQVQNSAHCDIELVGASLDKDEPVDGQSKGIGTARLQGFGGVPASSPRNSAMVVPPS